MERSVRLAEHVVSSTRVDRIYVRVRIGPDVDGPCHTADLPAGQPRRRVLGPMSKPARQLTTVIAEVDRRVACSNWNQAGCNHVFSGRLRARPGCLLTDR